MWNAVSRFPFVTLLRAFPLNIDAECVQARRPVNGLPAPSNRVVRFPPPYQEAVTATNRWRLVRPSIVSGVLKENRKRKGDDL